MAPVSYMSASNSPRKSPKFFTRRSLISASLSTLPRPPGCLVNYAVDYPQGNRAGHSPSYPVRNPESYSGGCPASYWARCLAENPASSREDCPDSNSAGYCADRPDGHPDENPESNLVSNGAGHSESHSVDSLSDYSRSYLESFDLRPVCRAAAGTTLLQLDDLADSVALEACGSSRTRCTPRASPSARHESLTTSTALLA